MIQVYVEYFFKMYFMEYGVIIFVLFYMLSLLASTTYSYEKHKQEVKANFRDIAWQLFTKNEREFHQCAIDLLVKEFKKNYVLDDITFIEKLKSDYSAIIFPLENDKRKWMLNAANGEMIKSIHIDDFMNNDLNVVPVWDILNVRIDEEYKYRINLLGLKTVWAVPPLVKQSSLDESNSTNSGQDQRDKEGLKKYIYWRQNIYKLFPKKFKKKIYKLEEKVKKIMLGIK